MKITKDTVVKVTGLANLQLSLEDESRYSEQLSKILDYIDQLNLVDTDNIEPLFNVRNQKNMLQEDKVEEFLSQKEATQNQETQNNMFVTKGVFSDE